MNDKHWFWLFDRCKKQKYHEWPSWTFYLFLHIQPVSGYSTNVQLWWLPFLCAAHMARRGHYLCRCLLLSEIEIWTLSFSGMHQYGKMIYFANRIYLLKEVFQNTPYTNNVGYLHKWYTPLFYTRTTGLKWCNNICASRETTNIKRNNNKRYMLYFDWLYRL
mgnify:CR=1 FL=1